MKPREWPFEIWPYLDIWNEDYQLIKRRYSALIQGSSDLELILLDNEMENVVICVASLRISAVTQAPAMQ